MAYPHWSLFEVIDEDLHAFSRQVEFAEANFATYSVILARLYLSVCSEVDVVAKLLCQRIGATLPDRPNIDHYRDKLVPQYPNLAVLPIALKPMPGKILTPWDSWNNGRNPAWWSEHNDVKHQRDLHFAKANLGNVLSAGAGLFVLLIYLYHSELYKGDLQPVFRVFMIDTYAGGLRWGWWYKLPDFGPSEK
jgi:hypothetical protein